jgi:hypothetical protein
MMIAVTFRGDSLALLYQCHAGVVLPKLELLGIASLQYHMNFCITFNSRYF